MCIVLEYISEQIIVCMACMWVQETAPSGNEAAERNSYECNVWLLELVVT